jgi:hypothetical protein
MDLVPGFRMGDPHNGTVLNALRRNLTTDAAVRSAVRNTLMPRFRVGLFDPPNASNPWKEIPASVILGPEHVQLAVRAAEGSQTLLKNVGGTLPLKAVASGGPKVLGVIGVASNSSQLIIDRYSGHPGPQHITTFLAGIEARAAKAGASVVTCPATATAAACAATLKTAGVDVVVMVTKGHTEGEQHDRGSLGLEPDQLGLLQTVHAKLGPASTVKKVLVVVAGGAVSTEEAEAMVGATVWSGKPGMQAGAGFASLLYGDVDFSGRVAATVYKQAWEETDFLTSSISGGAQPRGYRYLLRIIFA